MRESEFWAAIDYVYPRGRGRSLAQDLVLSALGERSPQQALDDGVDPQRVWDAIVAAQDLPEHYRFIHRLKPEDRQELGM